MPRTTMFRTRARVINQLGAQLIKSEAIALLELIKNSYDADASECEVVMRKLESEEDGSITVLDAGEGMDGDILRTAWLEIGTDYKDALLKNKDTRRSPEYNRLRLGENGIGS